MHILPSISVKALADVAPGELVVGTPYSDRSLAFFTRIAGDAGRQLPAFVWISAPSESNPLGIHYELVQEDERALTYGREFALNINPLIPDPPMMGRNRGATMVIGEKGRMLAAWDRYGTHALTMNLDTGLSTFGYPDTRYCWHCHSWDIRLTVEDKIDWNRPALFSFATPT